jgi:hypothetical protein
MKKQTKPKGQHWKKPEKMKQKQLTYQFHWAVMDKTQNLHPCLVGNSPFSY